MIDAVRPSAVAAAEQAPLLGLQPQQRDDRAAQVVGGRGEQLVLREGVEERDRGLVVVRALDQVLAARICCSLRCSTGVSEAGSA